MTIAELQNHLSTAPPRAIVVDSDDLEVIAIKADPSGATVTLWSEPK